MTAPRGLHTLARLHGVQRAYHDTEGRRISASPEALMAALRALGVDLPAASAIPARVEHRRRTLWERVVDPVVVAWTPDSGGLEDTAEGSFKLRTPASLLDRPVRVTVGLEGGGETGHTAAGASLERVRAEDLADTSFVERVVPLPPVPPGYHDLVVEVGTGRETRRHEALLIAAPGRAVGWDILPTGRVGPGSGAGHTGAWGLFAPLYALHEADGPAVDTPDYRLLGRFVDRAAETGASVVGTLPLMAAFLDRPYEPSPYSPVSRLFWNALYVAPDDDPSGEAAAPADAGTASAGDLLDPRAAMAARRPALEAEARRFFADGPEVGDGLPGPAAAASSLGGPPELEPFRARNPLADDYARFRALTEARGTWDRWPDRLRARDVRPGDYDRDVARYHLYVQHRAERQLAEVAERGSARGVSLYLDLPMGVHPRGYDVWRERSLFAASASAGAPPDALAPGGQDWGFPPLHPEASRLQGHRYFIASIRKHLRFAGVLRVDHVMQLHRMFWIPGGDARDGVYVRYPAEELYAVLCLESHRAGAVIVGEDLGTVPREVRRAMRKRGLPGMYVLQFELTEATDEGGGPDADPDADPDPDAGEALVPRKVPPGALASIGTHDTPTFAGWWWGEDVRIRQELGQLTDAEAEAELAGRGVMREKLVRGVVAGASAAPDSGADSGADAGAHPAAVAESEAEAEAVALRVQEALLRRLGQSDAGLVLATMEDLWLERSPQNVPGTLSEANWRRRSRRPLDALSDGPASELLDALNESREGNQ